MMLLLNQTASLVAMGVQGVEYTWILKFVIARLDRATQ
jgi:hypothetical protein